MEEKNSSKVMPGNLDRKFLASNIQKDSLPSLILEAIGDGLEYILVGALQPSKALKYGSSRVRSDYFGESKPKNIQRGLKRLKSRGFVKGDDLSLTDRGWSYYLQLKMKSVDMLDDERSLMIVFDIPESRRHDRDRLRRLLRSAGCISLQRSILVTPFDIISELQELLLKTNLREFVSIYYVEKVPPKPDRN